MNGPLQDVRWGLALVLLCLLMGIGLGISFGVNEDLYQNYIANGISAHPALHDPASQGAIWRWALRAHFHAAGVGAFTISLVILVALSNMSDKLKQLTAILIGLGGLYPMAWFVMFYVAPSIGRKAARQHWLVESLTYVAVGGLLLGLLSLLLSLMFAQEKKSE